MVSFRTSFIPSVLVFLHTKGSISNLYCHQSHSQNKMAPLKVDSWIPTKTPHSFFCKTFARERRQPQKMCLESIRVKRKNGLCASACENTPSMCVFTSGLCNSLHSISPIHPCSCWVHSSLRTQQFPTGSNVGPLSL